MIGLPAASRVWIAAGITDMRKGMDGLAAFVQTVLGERPFSGDVFVFRGKRGDLVKLLWWKRRRAEPVCQAARAWPVRMATGQQRSGVSHQRAARNAARRHRLAAAYTDVAADHGGIATAPSAEMHAVRALALQRRYISAHGRCARSTPG
jgi:transposase